MSGLSHSKFETEVIRVRTPNGTLFAFFLENPDGSINQFQFTIGKAGNDISPWAMAVAELMTLCINRGVSLEELINLLGGLTSSREARSVGSTCRSGPEGIWQALIRYKRSRFEALSKSLGIKINDDDDFRRASVASWARIRT